MPYTQIPRDLSGVKTKVALNLTKRQIICFSIAGAIGIPTYLVTRNFLGNSTAAFLMIGLMLPFFFLAMFEKDGQPAEKILRNIIRTRLWPGIRVYKTENLYKYLSEEELTLANKNKSSNTKDAKVTKKLSQVQKNNTGKAK